MSENIPESVPTSVSHRSQRPTKKRALTPASAQQSQVEALFANPERADLALPVGPRSKSAPIAPPDIVANVQGSSAGAGSGEFHVYKASRRREYERLRAMDEEKKEDEAEKHFEQQRARLRKEDEERLSKNRAKREKAKARQARKKAGVNTTEDSGADEKEENSGSKKKSGPAKAMLHANGAEEMDTEADGAREEAGLTIHDDD